MLFSFYIYDLSLILSDGGLDCHIDDLCITINLVFYTNDLCSMTPCAIALQEQIKLCYEYNVKIN